MEKVERILLMMPNWLGDAVMARPLLGLLRDMYPQAELIVLTPKHLKDIYLFQDQADRVVVWDKKYRLKALLLTARMLRKDKIDLAILCPNSFFSALLIACASISYRIGYQKEGRGFLLNKALPFPKDQRQKHQSRHFMALAFPLWTKKEPPKISLSLTVPSLEKQKKKAQLKKNYQWVDQPLMALGISSAYGPAKDWSPERYRYLGLELHKKYNAKILLLGMAKDADKARFVMRGSEHVFINLCGQTDLKEVQILLALCRIFIGNDSGLAHVSAALDVETVVIFGSTLPEFTQPLGSTVNVVYSKLDCSPCFKRTCPLGTMACMKDIRVEQVLKTVAPLMKKVVLS